MKTQPVILSAIAFFFCLVLPFGAFAGTDLQPTIQSLNNSFNEKAQNDEQNTNDIKTKLGEVADHQAQTQTTLLQAQIIENSEPSMHRGLLPAISAMPDSLLITDTLTHDLSDTRYRELNRIKIPTDTSSSATKYKPQYLVDTSTPTPVDVQAFDIYMRYFCDPNARNGDMASMQFGLNNVTFQDTTISYMLGCGKVSPGADGGNIANVETRDSVIGATDTKGEAAQVMGLPLRPADLFFNPVTFPTAPSTKTPNPNASNVDRLGYLYLAAYQQSLQLLIGSAPAASNSLNTQKQIAYQMLASYPFAVLFAERTGSMGPNAAQSMADFLRGKFGRSSSDPAIQAMLKNLSNRQNISLAEYMNIVMFQLPTSPGYYAYISTMRNPKKLIREEVWLTAMQTALNYQRNRWLEILATLEAVK